MYPNKIRISNGEGQVSITAISRAFEVGQVAEDFDLSKYTSVEHLRIQDVVYGSNTIFNYR